MKFKQFPLIVGFLALVFSACELFFPGNTEPVYEGRGGGRENGRFFAQDIGNSFYSVYADKLYSNEKCEIWAEKGANISAAEKTAVVDAYQKTNGIYDKIMNGFGTYRGFKDVLSGSAEIVATNTMELADYYGDNDGKLCILLLKIKDGFNPGTSVSYVAGYFSPYDFVSHDPNDPETWYSNERDMLYIDVKVERPGSTALNKTIAHEMQHLMNFITSIAERTSNNQIHIMDLWIDEGLSSAAEWVLSGPNQDRVAWYNNAQGQIPYGNNFYIWGNHPNDILDEYATVYLFFQWLRIQSQPAADIYREIINSGSSDYTAVTSAANSSSWEKLLGDWLTANYLNEAAGIHGYKGEISLSPRPVVLSKSYTGDPLNAGYRLEPGEGIYTKKTTQPPSGGSKIAYALLPGASKTLLSYNIDTNLNNGYSLCYPFSSETISSQSPIAAKPSARSLLSSNTGPYPISAGDMRRIRGHGEKAFDFDHSRLFRGIARDE